MTSPFLRFHPMGFSSTPRNKDLLRVGWSYSPTTYQSCCACLERFPSKKLISAAWDFCVLFFGGGRIWKRCVFLLVWFDMNQVAWTPQTLGKHLLKWNMEVTNVPSHILERSYSSVPHYLGPHHFGVFVFNFHRVTVNENLSLMLTAPFCSCGFGYLNTEPNRVFGALLGCPWKLATS